jgi:hypothetical protein
MSAQGFRPGRVPDNSAKREGGTSSGKEAEAHRQVVAAPMCWEVVSEASPLAMRTRSATVVRRRE